MSQSKESTDLVQVFRGELKSLNGLLNQALGHLANQEMDSAAQKLVAGRRHIGAMLQMLPEERPDNATAED